MKAETKTQPACLPVPNKPADLQPNDFYDLHLGIGVGDVEEVIVEPAKVIAVECKQFSARVLFARLNLDFEAIEEVAWSFTLEGRLSRRRSGEPVLQGPNLLGVIPVQGACFTDPQMLQYTA